jgi:hypothetical protein
MKGGDKYDVLCRLLLLCAQYELREHVALVSDPSVYTCTAVPLQQPRQSRCCGMQTPSKLMLTVLLMCTESHSKNWTVGGFSALKFMP